MGYRISLRPLAFRSISKFNCIHEINTNCSCDGCESVCMRYAPNIGFDVIESNRARENCECIRVRALACSFANIFVCTLQLMFFDPVFFLLYFAMFMFMVRYIEYSIEILFVCWLRQIYVSSNVLSNVPRLIDVHLFISSASTFK